jgi:hypothetical protein
MKHIIHTLILISAMAFAAACGGDDGYGGDADAGMCVPGTGAAALYDTCTTNADCDSCICHSYNMGGLLCTKACTNDNDCPAPSTGCNNMGVCKRPQ